MFRKILSLFTIFILISSGCTKAPQNIKKVETPKPQVANSNLLQFQQPKKGDEIGVFTTSMGTFKVQFYPQYAPKAVQNLKELAKKGYYNGLLFHRVIRNFMVQSGDPKGNGTGGQSIWSKPFEDEFTSQLHNFRGALSMANIGQPDTNGSQFFIVQANDVPENLISQMQDAGKEYFSDEVIEKYKEVGGAPWLDYHHTVFGQVFEGMDVVDKIASVKTGEGDKPERDIKIEKIEIVKY